MRGLNIGEQARRGEYCDICKKTIYFNIWGHIAMHRRELERRENARAAREASKQIIEELKERQQCAEGYAAYKRDEYRSVKDFMSELETELR